MYAFCMSPKLLCAFVVGCLNAKSLLCMWGIPVVYTKPRKLVVGMNGY